MKKKLPVLIALLAVAVVLTAAGLNSMPEPGKARAFIAGSPEGEDVWLIDNRQSAAFLYRIGRDDKMTYVHSERASAGRLLSFGTAATDGQYLYYLRLTGPASSGQYSGWEIARLDPEERFVTTLYTGGRSLLSEVDSLVPLGGKLIVSGRAVNGQAQAFALDAASPSEPEQVMAVAPPSGEEFLRAVYSGGSLYCLLNNGSIARFNEAGALRALYEGEFDAIWAGSAGVCYLDAASGQLYYENAHRTVQVGGFDGSVTVRACAARSESELTILAEAGGRLAIVRVSGNKAGDAVYQFKTSPVIAGGFILSAVDLPVIAVIAAIFALLATVLAARRFRLIAVRVAARCACGVVVAFALLIAAACGMAQSSMTADRLSQLAYLTASRAGQITYAQFDAACQPDSPPEDVAALRGLLAAQSLEQPDGRLYLQSDLLTEKDGRATVVISQSKPSGVSAKAAYDRGVAELVSRAVSSMEAQSAVLEADGRKSAVQVLPVRMDGEAVAIVVGFASMEDVTARIGRMRAILIGAGAGAALFCVLLVAFLCRRLTRPMKDLAERMRVVSEGSFEPENYPYGDDDVGQMQRALEEMCMSLAIQKYDAKATIDSYYRFVPRGIDKLLDRASIAEVACGDVRTVRGQVGLVSVGRLDEIRRRIDNNHLMSFVNHCFFDIQQQAQRYGALFLTGDFDISGLKLMFDGNPEAGLRFGLGLVGRESETEPGIPAPSYYLILHDAEFLYGVAGSEDNAFPFLSSAELNFLSSMSEGLQSLGLRVVITEQYKKLLGDSCTTRYIGFVSSHDRRHAFKIHEVLDVYSDKERLLRLGYDAKFQEAIQLFYKNDFYLARNIFSSLLKTCPGDGAVRWYIFACEYFFSRDISEANYNLFGIEELVGSARV